MALLNMIFRLKLIRLSSRLSLLFLIGAVIIYPTFIAAGEIDSSIARGGLLYDKWFSVLEDADVPETAHPSYPAKGRYKGKKGADWRCKECHGWDYMGREGAYSKGKHHTGVKGIRAYYGEDPNLVMKLLQDQTHGYTKNMMSIKDMADLAQFVTKGQVDMDRYIDRATKTAKGNKVTGERLYNTICANCHGKNGAMNEEGKPISRNREPLDRLAKNNPWEALHKILNGQPDENMPALRVLDPQISVDIIAHLQALPAKVVARK